MIHSSADGVVLFHLGENVQQHVHPLPGHQAAQESQTQSVDRAGWQIVGTLPDIRLHTILAKNPDLAPAARGQRQSGSLVGHQ